MSIENHYRVLGVPKRATDAEIKAAYGHLARLYHPDHTSNDKVLSDKFCVITAAYNVLKVPKVRKEYDAKLALMGKRCSVCGGTGGGKKRKGYTKSELVPCDACGGTGAL